MTLIKTGFSAQKKEKKNNNLGDSGETRCTNSRIGDVPTSPKYQEVGFPPEVHKLEQKHYLMYS